MHIGIMLHLTPEHGQDAHAVYQDFTSLVRFAEALGVEEAWVTEHHFQPYSLCPAPHLLMAHFLASTQRMRLGSAATLLGFHEPLRIAEELATLSALAPGRVMAGFAKGGPFEAQNRVFKMEGDEARARMQEALPAMQRAMQGEAAHEGAFYRWASIDLQPRAQPIPVFLASSDASSIRLAAQQGYGLMGAQFWPLARIAAMRQDYMREQEAGLPPDFMLSRGVLIDDDSTRARERALAHVHDFRTQKSQLWGKHKGPLADMPDEVLLQQMLVGTVDEVLAGASALSRLGVTRLALNPLTARSAERQQQIGRYMREVHPRVSAHRPELEMS